MPRAIKRPPSYLTPTLARSFVALVVSLSCLSSVSAQGLGETELIALAKAQTPGALVAKAEVALAKAAIASAAVRDNPSLSLEHEHFPSGASEAEDAVVLTLPIDLSRRRASRRSLAQSGVASASARSALAQSRAVHRVLQLFYRLLAAQEVVGLKEAALVKLQRATQVVTRQKEEGRVSGYDQIRIEIELEVRQSELRQERAKVSQTKVELAGLLGLTDAEAKFSGSLDLISKGETSSLPSSLSFLRMASTRATEARKLAKKGWLPTVELSLGPRLGLGGDTRFGYVAGISVELPFYSKNEALRAQTQARVSLTQARAKEAELAAKRRRQRAEAVMQAADTEAKKFQEATESRIERLERAAASRYREGQSIIELLDAQSARSQVDNRRLELRLKAKEAELSLRAARGEFE